MPKRRNSQEFTTDEIKTAVTAYTEGSPYCRAFDKYRYPSIRINMCVKEALEPIARAMKIKITRGTTKKVVCRPEDFPPDGKGMWQVTIPEYKIKKLYPLIPQTYIKRWHQRWQQMGCLPTPPKRPRFFSERWENRSLELNSQLWFPKMSYLRHFDQLIQAEPHTNMG